MSEEFDYIIIGSGAGGGPLAARLAEAKAGYKVLVLEAGGLRVEKASQAQFELAGWSEVNIVIRFWIIAGIGVAISLGLFYGDFLRTVH